MVKMRLSLIHLRGKGFILDFFTDSDQTIQFYNWQGDFFVRYK